MIYATLYDRHNNAITGQWHSNEKTARLWAKEVLPPTVTTNDCYWRDVGRAPSVRLEVGHRRPTAMHYGKRPKRLRLLSNGRTACWIEPEVVIVPSVGELGWTP